MSEFDEDQGVDVLPGQIEVRQERKPRKASDLKPCERCRSQHLKCVYNTEDTKCERCQRSGNDCVRSTKKIRFRDVPVSKFRNDRKVVKNVSHGLKARNGADEEFITQSTYKIDPMDNIMPNNGKDKYSIESNATEYMEVKSSVTSFEATENADPLQKMADIHGEVTPSYAVHTPSQINEPSQHLDSGVDFVAPPLLPTPSEDRFPLGIWQDVTPLTKVFSSDRGSNPSFQGSPYGRGRKASSNLYLDQLVKPSARVASDGSRDYLENILLRYFHEELACWFDLCDPDRHFATVIPQKAREPGPLRSAILTIAARNLSRNKRFRNSAGMVEWRGRALPDLKEEFAVPYHNECIRDLLQLSMDPRKLHDETLLAAVLALRTDEEMGLNTEGDAEDQQLFLRIANVFIEAQLPPALALPHSSPEVFPSTLIDDATHSNMASPSVHTDDLGASGLRQACFWTAFRQDLHAAFLKQQPVRFPLSRCEAFRQLSPATDAVWANRMVTFCADVLEFSYGSDSSDGKITPAYTNHDRWRELRDREKMLCTLLPTTFEPTFCSEPDLGKGIFPEIWYLDSCHVSGTTYIEMARMLLEVFNPTRPKLGHGFLAATNAFINSTKKILFRLCGIALSNQHCPPSLINACLGISMFGEYFEDPAEQEALLGVLTQMQNRYAYPTTQIAQSLQRAWSNDAMEVMSSVAS